MDSLIDYIFGTGDGSTTTWSSRADLDLDGNGAADAVRLDFDGDGRRDDALWDTDADGVADLVVIDLGESGLGGESDLDSHGSRFYSDSGRGLWDVREGARPTTGINPTTDTDSTTGTDSHDLDGDGRADVELSVIGGRGGRLYLDADGDGTFDQVLIDSDGDGRADTMRRRGEPGFDR
ncbi:hypothetical protein GII33_00355 [Gordonia pseudamarae]|mgnify:CR=1 FL=1|jgi:hypothetical protein|uniref:Pullulanase n=1 Tax=Gordonia pseudamarae TaxID=2831662 RepID=A0ABX6IE10_9ACTN|nr:MULTISPECIES: hypothetical protein [Gordonia]MBD0024359.1 hypothetical protein [Gordonia sp. (in: high G+C Gram-positive bacteria)]QHN24654.1 hypothetical protein GII33_00355 [Gordonia pseudamarae]QHN33584.1 hypothetical protein GII31_00350 [Gordonia pseudamarae]